VLRRAEEIIVSAVVLGELLSGFRGGKRQQENREELDDFFRSPRVRLVGVDEETALRYSEIIVYLRSRGTPIPTNDVWIAAGAMQLGLRVVTTDPHFERVPQVTVELFAPMK